MHGNSLANNPSGGIPALLSAAPLSSSRLRVSTAAGDGKKNKPRPSCWVETMCSMPQRDASFFEAPWHRSTAPDVATQRPPWTCGETNWTVLLPPCCGTRADGVYKKMEIIQTTCDNDLMVMPSLLLIPIVLGEKLFCEDFSSHLSQGQFEGILAGCRLNPSFPSSVSLFPLSCRSCSRDSEHESLDLPPLLQSWCALKVQSSPEQGWNQIEA